MFTYLNARIYACQNDVASGTFNKNRAQQVRTDGTVVAVVRIEYVCARGKKLKPYKFVEIQVLGRRGRVDRQRSQESAEAYYTEVRPCDAIGAEINIITRPHARSTKTHLRSIRQTERRILWSVRGRSTVCAFIHVTFLVFFSRGRPNRFYLARGEQRKQNNNNDKKQKRLGKCGRRDRRRVLHDRDSPPT